MVPDTLRGRWALGPSHVAVLAVLVAMGLAVTSWWVIRGDPEPVDTPGPVLAPTDLVALTAAPALPALPAGGSPVGAPDGSVTVDVAGKVRRPGIAVLDAGARVVDALEAAGGARPGVDLSTLNLARVLVDGEQILVGARSVPTTLAPAATPAPGVGGPLVSLNAATETELETLPEVGPVTAAAIVSWRTEHGGFTAIDELLEVDGIGDATLAVIAPFVTV